MRRGVRDVRLAPALAGATATVLLAGCFSMVGGPAVSQQGQVGLTFTGPVEVAVDASGGSCGVAPPLLNEDRIAFGFFVPIGDATSGYGFSAIEVAPDALKLWLSTSAGTFEVSGVTGAFSNDHKSITIDADLVGEAGTEHVTGTVTCP